MEANPTAFSVVGCSHRAQGWLPCQVESNRMAGRSSGQGRSEGSHYRVWVWVDLLEQGGHFSQS